MENFKQITKQITVTERNRWENETFSYILNIDDEMLIKLKDGLKNKSNVKIEECTTHTKESIIPLNNASSNTYMDRYQFCEICLPAGKFDWYYDVIYKAVGLNTKRLKYGKQ
jgi:hypothetical protein